MRIGPSLILASRQTLAMTPQLQQAIKLLQFSHLELAAFIQQELEKNPLLSEGASDEGPIAEQDAPIIEAPSDTAEALAPAPPAPPTPPRPGPPRRPPWPTPPSAGRASMPTAAAMARQAASASATMPPVPSI